MRNIFDGYSGGTDLVEDQLGESYRVVKEVQSSLASIETAAANIQSIIDAAPAAEQVILALSVIQNLAAGVIYDTTSQGLDPVTGVLDGEFFATWEDGRMRIYLKSGGTAVLKLELSTLDNPSLPFVQSGTGAVARTVQSKLRDVVNVMDFGAVGDGVADDTAELQAALNTGKTVVIPTNVTLKITQTVFATGTASMIGQSNRTSTILLSGAAFTTAGGNQVAIALGTPSAGAAAVPWLGMIDNVRFLTDATSKFNRAICDFASYSASVTNCVFDFALGLGWTSPHAGGSMGPFTSSQNGSWASGWNFLQFGRILFRNNVAVCSANQVSAEGFGFVGYHGGEISNNQIDGIGDDPIALHGCYNLGVFGNRCSSTDGRLYIEYCEDLEIHGNKFSRCLGADGKWWSIGAVMLRVTGDFAIQPTLNANNRITIRDNVFAVPGTIDANSTYCLLSGWMFCEGVQSGLTIEGNIIHNQSPSIGISAGAISVLTGFGTGWTGPVGNPDYTNGGTIRSRDVVVRANRATGLLTGGIGMTSAAAGYLGPTIIDGNSFDRYQPPGVDTTDLRQSNRTSTGAVTTFENVSPVVLYRNPTIDFSFTALTDTSTSGSPKTAFLAGGGAYVADVAGRICGAVLLMESTGTPASSVYLRILKNGVQIGADLSNLTSLKRRLFSYNAVAGMTFAASDEITVQLYCSAGQVVSLVGKVKLQVMFN